MAMEWGMDYRGRGWLVEKTACWLPGNSSRGLRNAPQNEKRKGKAKNACRSDTRSLAPREKKTRNFKKSHMSDPFKRNTSNGAACQTFFIAPCRTHAQNQHDFFKLPPSQLTHTHKSTARTLQAHRQFQLLAPFSGACHLLPRASKIKHCAALSVARRPPPLAQQQR